MEDSKVLINYFIDLNLIGKRVKKASDRDIYRPDHNKVAEECRAYEG
jgi:hypothetical protein